MKRDFDLLRALLLRMESINKRSFDEDDLLDLCEDKNLLYLHLHLLVEAGYIKLHDHVSYSGGERFLISHITSSGYDYLDSVRNESVWTPIRKKIGEYGGSLALAIVRDLADAAIRARLGL